MKKLIKNAIGFDFEELMPQFDFLKEDDFIYLGGSIIEGCVSPYSENMGNRLSDVDVFIITDNYNLVTYNYIDECKKTYFINYKGKNLDIEVYDKKKVLMLLENLKVCDFSIEKYTRNLVQVDEVSFYEYASMIHRMINGFPIFNERAFINIKDLINRDNYFRLLKRLTINNIDNEYDDIVGNLDNENYEVALFLSRDVLIQTIKIFLLSNQISLDSDKWILFKLKNFAKVSQEAKYIQQQFNALYICELSGDTAIKQNVKSILNFSNRIISAVTERAGF